MKLKFNLIFAISLLFAVQTFGQNKINDPRLVEYRKAYPELDTLISISNPLFRYIWAGLRII